MGKSIASDHPKMVHLRGVAGEEKQHLSEFYCKAVPPLCADGFSVWLRNSHVDICRLQISNLTCECLHDYVVYNCAQICHNVRMPATSPE